MKQGLANSAPRLCARQHRRYVRALRISREKENVAVTAGCQNHGVGQMRIDLAGDQVARDDAARLPSITIRSSISVRGYIVTRARLHLPLERLVCAQQKLLAGLTARIESAGNLRSAERSVRQRAAVLARKGHALRHALVDDVDADLRQAIDVRFARAEIAALHRVVEEAVDAVAVVLIILRGVDSALRRDECARRGES